MGGPHKNQKRPMVTKFSLMVKEEVERKEDRESGTDVDEQSLE